MRSVCLAVNAALIAGCAAHRSVAPPAPDRGIRPPWERFRFDGDGLPSPEAVQIAAERSPQVERFTLSVLNSFGTPLVGVQVRVRPVDELRVIAEGTTDERGSVTFTELEGEHFELLIHAGDVFERRSATLEGVVEGQLRLFDSTTFPLVPVYPQTEDSAHHSLKNPGPFCTGRVVDESGSPVEGATVHVGHAGEGSVDSGVLTDERGRYRIQCGFASWHAALRGAQRAEGPLKAGRENVLILRDTATLVIEMESHRKIADWMATVWPDDDPGHPGEGCSPTVEGGFTAWGNGKRAIVRGVRVGVPFDFDIAPDDNARRAQARFALPHAGTWLARLPVDTFSGIAFQAVDASGDSVEPWLCLGDKGHPPKFAVTAFESCVSGLFLSMVNFRVLRPGEMRVRIFGPSENEPTDADKPAFDRVVHLPAGDVLDLGRIVVGSGKAE